MLLLFRENLTSLNEYGNLSRLNVLHLHLHSHLHLGSLADAFLSKTTNNKYICQKKEKQHIRFLQCSFHSVLLNHRHILYKRCSCQTENHNDERPSVYLHMRGMI